ncbi:MAG: CNNM domain-containing protein [Gemmatimonadota bacterium]|nr:CNNM domain-containing protein [Gemmatimonadota bacterium]
MIHYWMALAFALAMVAWLTAAATAVRSVSRIWLRHWVEQRFHAPSGEPSHLPRSERLLAAAAAATTVVVVLAGSYMGARGPTGAGLVLETAIATVVLLLFGQLLPRAIARRFAPSLVPVLVPTLRLGAWLTDPLVRASQSIARGLGGHRRGETETATERIEDLLREGELEGIGEPEEIEIISGVVQFGGKTLRDVMTPRTKMFVLDQAMAPRDAARAVAQSGYSRVPVIRESLDDIVGMVLVFDVFKAGGETMPPIRPVAQAPATTRCGVTLFEMLRAQRHLTVVLDEYGGTAGIVTLEDLLEELVGEIRDEHDEHDESASPAGSRTRAVVLEPSSTLGQAAEQVGVDLPHPDAATWTLGRALIRGSARIPQLGERFRLGALEMVVVEAQSSRVTRVLVQRAESTAPAELALPF